MDTEQHRGLRNLDFRRVLQLFQLILDRSLQVLPDYPEIHDVERPPEAQQLVTRIAAQPFPCVDAFLELDDHPVAQHDETAAGTPSQETGIERQPLVRLLDLAPVHRRVLYEAPTRGAKSFEISSLARVPAPSPEAASRAQPRGRGLELRAVKHVGSREGAVPQTGADDLELCAKSGEHADSLSGPAPGGTRRCRSDDRSAARRRPRAPRTLASPRRWRRSAGGGPRSRCRPGSRTARCRGRC